MSSLDNCNYVTEYLFRTRVFMNQKYDSLMVQSKIPKWTEIVQISFLYFCLPRFYLDYFVELLNNFEGLNALLVTQETMIDENIERILNSVQLFFFDYKTK